ncbi:unnamed protein product, partial [Rotaria magnacalcarata]
MAIVGDFKPAIIGLNGVL